MSFEEFQNQSRLYVLGALEPDELQQFEDARKTFGQKGEDFIVYYGAADVSVAGARVNKTALIDSLEQAIALGEGGIPL